jgi:hypothetical protein
MFSGGDNSAPAQQDNTVDPTAAPDPTMSTPDAMQPVGPPPMDDTGTTDQPVSEAAELPAVVPPSTPVVPNPVSTDDLLDIKQNALQQLSPLLGHLDQPPEERFRTTMMMIQASDNSTLLKSAYEAAQQITDDKVRAQALLDVVNEINYFTQHDEGEAEPAA